jgi:hypothetical protein
MAGSLIVSVSMASWVDSYSRSFNRHDPLAFYGKEAHRVGFRTAGRRKIGLIALTRIPRLAVIAPSGGP